MHKELPIKEVNEAHKQLKSGDTVSLMASIRKGYEATQAQTSFIPTQAAVCC